MGSIRIIAGKHRGRKLPVMELDGLRPTTDRVKETLFNWLMPYINEANCLDCFAGAGSLGFEALSRGASKVIFLEKNKHAAQQLQHNLAHLKQNNSQVFQTDSLLYLQKEPPQPFDLIFIDPPFRKGFIPQITQQLNPRWLAKNALIYIESESDFQVSLLPQNWQLLKEKKAGQVTYRLYQSS